MILKILSTIKRYIVELGKEGNIISMRLRELTKNIDKEQMLILKDYTKAKFKRDRQLLSNFSFDGLLDIESIARVLFESELEASVMARGYRVLSKTSLMEKEIKALIDRFKTLNSILEANKIELLEVLKNQERVDKFQEEIKKIKEQIMVGKKL